MTNYVTKMRMPNGTVMLEGLKRKTRVRQGKTYESDAEIVDGVFKYNALVSKDGQRIVLYGKVKNGAFSTRTMKSSEEYTKTFNVGDVAEYGSYNLTYLGTITKITDKCVTIEAHYGTRNSETHRLDIAEFAGMNYDFDLDAINKHNEDMMMTI